MRVPIVGLPSLPDRVRAYGALADVWKRVCDRKGITLPADAVRPKKRPSRPRKVSTVPSPPGVAWTFGVSCVVTRGGKRLSNDEVETRVACVVALLDAQTPRAKIIATMAKEFRSAPRTTDEYIRRAHARAAAATAAAETDQRARTVTRLERLSTKLERKGAWGPLVHIERTLVDIHGLRRGAVAVEAPPVQTNGLPNLAPEDAFDAWVFSTDAIARMCTMPSAPPPGPKRIEAVRGALRRLGEALDVAEACAGPSSAAVSMRSSRQYDDE